MKNLRFKRVLRFDKSQKLLRLFRVTWERGQVGDGRGYSAKVAIGLAPRLFHRDDGRITVLGVRVHYAKSYGGIWA